MSLILLNCPFGALIVVMYIINYVKIRGNKTSTMGALKIYKSDNVRINILMNKNRSEIISEINRHETKKHVQTTDLILTFHLILFSQPNNYPVKKSDNFSNF